MGRPDERGTLPPKDQPLRSAAGCPPTGGRLRVRAAVTFLRSRLGPRTDRRARRERLLRLPRQTFETTRLHQPCPQPAAVVGPLSASMTHGREYIEPLRYRQAACLLGAHLLTTPCLSFTIARIGGSCSCWARTLTSVDGSRVPIGFTSGCGQQPVLHLQGLPDHPQLDPAVCHRPVAQSRFSPSLLLKGVRGAARAMMPKPWTAEPSVLNRQRLAISNRPPVGR